VASENAGRAASTAAVPRPVVALRLAFAGKRALEPGDAERLDALLRQLFAELLKRPTTICVQRWLRKKKRPRSACWRSRKMLP
jgi:hypothetical protein